MAKANVELLKTERALGQLNSLTTSGIINLFESVPDPVRKVYWNLLDANLRAVLINQLPDSISSSLVEELSDQDLVDLVQYLEFEDLVDLKEYLQTNVRAKVFEELDEENKERLEIAVQTIPDTIGSVMTTDIISVRPSIELRTVLRYLRLHEQLPENFGYLYVLDNDQLVGRLSISSLLTNDVSQAVKDVMDTDFTVFTTGKYLKDAVDSSLTIETLPVVDNEGMLVGEVRPDDIIQWESEQAVTQTLALSGVKDEDTFAPLLKTTFSRGAWLVINLFTAILATATIDLFTGIMIEIIVLAAMLPIVASMGGMCGTQTMSIIIRAITQKQISKKNKFWLLRRELMSASLIGLALAIPLGLSSYFWTANDVVAISISLAVAINLLVGALSGVFVPLILARWKFDYISGSPVIVTTLTDVIGFASFLGLAVILNNTLT